MREQLQVAAKFKASKRVKKPKNGTKSHHKRAPRHKRAPCVLPVSVPLLFRTGTNKWSVPVPSNSGPCVQAYLDDMRSSACFDSTIALAEAALLNEWPLWYDTHIVSNVRGVTIYHTHVAVKHSATWLY